MLSQDSGSLLPISKVHEKGTPVLKRLKGHGIMLMWCVPKCPYSLDGFSYNGIACYCFV